MSTNEITAKVKRMKKLQAKAQDLNDEISAIQDELKALMTEQKAEELKAGEYKIRYVAITSSRFDSKSFKESYSALYEQFLKPSVTKRFSVA